MNVDWYVFEESYLLDINYRICDCKIIISIDAKKSKQHPSASQIRYYEDTFEEINIVLNGVLYYRGINSIKIKDYPNDDIGSIYSMKIDNSHSIEDGLQFKYNDSSMKILIKNNNEVIGEIPSKAIEDIKFIEFVSEMITFRAAVTALEIISNEDNI